MECSKKPTKELVMNLNTWASSEIDTEYNMKTKSGIEWETNPGTGPGMGCETETEPGRDPIRDLALESGMVHAGMHKLRRY